MIVNSNLIKADIYTTTERVVGKWINDKPLYQKEIDLGALPNATSKDYMLNMTPIDIIVDVNVRGISSQSEYIPIPRMTGSSSYINYYVTTHNSTQLKLVIIPTMDLRRFNGYATIKYYKTTD